MSARKRIGVFFSLMVLLVLPLTIWSVRNLNFETRKKAEEPKSPIKVVSAASFSQYQRPIVIVDLLVDKPSKNVEIVSLEKGMGIVPDYRNPTAFDYLEVMYRLKDGSKKSLLIPLPAKEVVDRITQDGKLTGSEKSLDKFSFSIILPYEEESEVSIEKKFTSAIISATDITSTNLFFPKFDQTQAQVNNKGITKELPLTEFSAGKISQGQSEDFQIEEIFDGDPSQTDPGKTVDILFIASGFSAPEFDLYRDFTDRAADSLIGFSKYPGKSPFPENKSLVKMRRIVSSTNYYDCIPYSIPQLDWKKIDEDVAALGIPVDQLSVVVNCSGASYATLGGRWTILSYSEYQSPLVFAHEIAHSFGGVLDEYVNHEESGELWDYGRNCKEDPEEPWLENLPGGAYLGCDYYRNIYRPEQNSLMEVISDDEVFNAPSKHLLEEAFAAYTQAGISVMAASGRIKIWRWLNEPPVVSDNTFYVYNLGKSRLSFSGYLDPQVDWANGKLLQGIIEPLPSPDYAGEITIRIDNTKLTVRGKYETTLILEFTDDFSNTKTVRIPIIIVAGDSSSTPALSISSPQDGDIFTLGDVIPISISQQIEPPGWKRIEYFYSDPYDDYSQNFIPISSRTVWPHTESWNTVRNSSSYLYPGEYQLRVEGHAYFAPTPGIRSQINVELLAPSGFQCYYSWHCSNDKSSRKCFRNSTDCNTQGLTYCCPPCPNQSLGNLDCDQQALINEGDLSVLLAGWGSITVTDLNLLLANWKTQ